MTEIKGEQQTASQAYSSMSEANKLLCKTILEMILLLLNHGQNEQNFEN